MAVEFMRSGDNRRRFGGLFLTGTLTLLNTACVSWVGHGESYQEVQARIPSGLLAPGDNVKLTTASGEHQFRVTRVDLEAGIVAGEDEAVNIGEIVAVEKREPDMRRTIVLSVLLGAAVLSTVVEEDCSFYCFDATP